MAESRKSIDRTYREGIKKSVWMIEETNENKILQKPTATKYVVWARICCAVV